VGSFSRTQWQRKNTAQSGERRKQARFKEKGFNNRFKRVQWGGRGWPFTFETDEQVHVRERGTAVRLQHVQDNRKKLLRQWEAPSLVEAGEGRTGGEPRVSREVFDQARRSKRGGLGRYEACDSAEKAIKEIPRS